VVWQGRVGNHSPYADSILLAPLFFVVIPSERSDEGSRRLQETMRFHLYLPGLAIALDQQLVFVADLGEEVADLG